MARVEQQIQAAQSAEAADFAPVDLGFAKKRYQQAQAAMSAKKYQLAQDMANEAVADARLARTRAELAAVRRQIRAQKTENTRLRTQLLNDSAAAKATSGNTGSGVPSQIVLPQPKAPPAAMSTPAPPTSAPAAAGGGS